MPIHRVSVSLSRGLSLAALLVGGCGGDDEVACDYVPCDIAEEACVRKVAEAVGCHLEREILYPEVRRITVAEWVAELEAEAEPPSAEEARAQADYYRMQGLLGLMPADYAPEDSNEDYVRNFAAFYSPDDQKITMISDSQSVGLVGDYVTLVHEMVHAYQDAAWDLRGLDEAHAYTYDRFLGLRAFVEGHAVLFQNFAYLEIDGVDPLKVDWDAYFGDWQDDSLMAAFASETPALDTNAFFPYAFGGEFALQGWQEDGVSGLDEVSGRPPDSVRQVMGGYAAWPDQRTNADAAFDPRAVAVLPDEYLLLGGGHEGVWSLNATLQRTAGGGLWSATLDEVSADYLTAWRWHDDAVVALWRVRSARPGELFDALTGSGARWIAAAADVPTTHLIARVDDDVLLIAVSDGDARTVLADIAGWQSPDEAFPGQEMAGVRVPRPIACGPFIRAGSRAALPAVR